MGPRAAAAIAREEFPQWIQQPAWAPPALEPGERVAGYRGDRAMLIKRDGERGGALAISPLPLRTTAADGSKRLVDLALQPSGDGFRPRNALVTTQLPGRLSEGVDFPGRGLSLLPVDGGDGAARRVEDKLFYDNVALDSDVILAPLPDGVEAYYQLRSPAAPEAFTMKVAGGAEFATTPDGGAELRRADTHIATVRPPIALDAQGQPVTVRYQASGDALIVRVDHRGKDVAYPIMVDPVFSYALNYASASGFAGWQFGTPWPGWFTGGYCTNGGCVWLQTAANRFFGSWTWGWWAQTIPNGPGGTTYTFRAEWGHLRHAAPTSACATVGIYNPSSADWERGGVSNDPITQSGAPGPFVNCPGMPDGWPTTCARPDCSWDAQPGSFPAFQQWMFGDATRTRADLAWVEEPISYWRDYDNPTITETYWSDGATATGWTRSGTLFGQYRADDAGMGLYRIGASGSQVDEVDDIDGGDYGCSGDWSNPCPHSWTSNYNVYPDEGISTVSINATDVIGRGAAPVTRQVKYDGTAPDISVPGGGLHALGDQAASDDSYDMTVDAVDSIAGINTSGVRTLQFLVDGQSVQQQSNPCPQNQDCDMTGVKVTFHPYNYAQGTHTLALVATDGAGNVATDSWNVNVAAGAVVTPKEGAKAARWVTLKAQAKKSGQTTVRWQYRIGGASGTWTDIPLSALRNDRNELLTSASLALTSGASAPVGFDMAAIPGLTTTPGVVLHILGVFSGGDAGTTQAVRVDLDPKGLDSRSAVTDIGPGTVNLLTGNFTLSDTDVSIDNAMADMTVTRTFNSRAAADGASGPFGPGWTSSTPVSDVGAEYARVEEKPGTIFVNVVLSDGTQLPFTQTAAGLTPEPGSEALKLVHPPVAGGTKDDPDRYEVRDLDGNATRFVRSAGNPTVFLPEQTSQPASESKTTFVLETAGSVQRVKTEYAPMPTGIDCRATFDDSCRALDFVYATTTTATGTTAATWGDYVNRLVAISFRAYDPATGAVTTDQVARYQYDNTGHLRAQWDPRISPALKTTYDYDANGLVTQVTEPGVRPWTLAYGQLPGDAAPGRLTQVSRDSLTASGVARWTVAYGIPLSGSGAPAPMRASDLDAVGQKNVPTDATAIFPPDQVPSGSPPPSYTRATVYYLNRDGFVVNELDPGGFISTSERDEFGNVVRELTPANRARALAATNPAARAAELDTQRRYAASGLELVEETGPTHRVRLSTGEQVDARRHTFVYYDEANHGQTAANTDGPWHLPTTVKVGALIPGRTVDADVRTTSTDYDFKFRAATKVVNDVDGLALTNTMVLDPQTGLVIEQRRPRQPGGGEASTTKTVFYTRDASSADQDCRSKPQWHNLPCKTGPAAQPSASASGAVGTTTVQSTVDTDAAGAAEAFADTANTTGPITRLSIYLDAGNTASAVQVGVYSNASSRPASLLGSCTISTPTAGAWNRCSVPSFSVTAGTAYWTAALQPTGSTGAIKFRTGGTATAYGSSSSSLASLPATYVAGSAWAGTGAASIYGDSPTLPDLPVSTLTYNKLDQVSRETETVGTSGTITRATVTGHDAAGRETSEDVTSTEGTAVPRVDRTYDAATGLPLATTTTSGKTVTRGYDALGRLTSYKDSNATTATTTYDLLGRAATTDDGKGTQSYAYDAVRGLLTGLTDSQAGNLAATYDADGTLIRRTYPNGLAADVALDETGAPVGLTYTKTTNCSSACTWLQSSVVENIHGQWMRQDGTLSAQIYQYDGAGRLKQVDDTPAGQGCTIRSYTYDRDSNRTESRTRAPATGGACNPTAAGSVQPHAYDSADRITDAGYVYDRFGRITSVPAGDAGGKPLSAGYYVNDRAQSITQDGRTTTYVLDPLRRLERRDIAGAPEDQHYDSDSDNPSWVAQGTAWTRYVSGIDGDLVAVRDSAGTTTLELTNLHGDVIGEASTSATATGPTATFESDEFGVPRTLAPPPISVVGATSAALTTNATTMAITRPAAAATGDLLVAEIAASANATITPPSGWTAASGAQVATGSSRYQLFWRLATASEPTSYTFSFSASGAHRGGIKVLRNTDRTTPINIVATATGTTANVTAPAVTPTVANAAISRFAGNDQADTDGSGAWGFPTPIIKDWDAANTSRSAASSTQILTGAANVSTGTSTITNQTGAAAAAWGAITTAIAPTTTATSTRRYGWLGAKQRSAETPTGVIRMGARLYVPQTGRFLQVDPVPGGSANDYDYARQDPVNNFDLDGNLCPDSNCKDTWPKGCLPGQCPGTKFGVWEVIQLATLLVPEFRAPAAVGEVAGKLAARALARYLEKRGRPIVIKRGGRAIKVALHEHKGGPHQYKHIQIERWKPGVKKSRKEPPWRSPKGWVK
jgi:RHS repeat-associated protein